MRFVEHLVETGPIPQALPATILDALPEQVCAIDPTGKVVAVNEAWVRFAQDNGVPGGEGFLGANYLDICDLAYLGSTEPDNVADGLRSVMNGGRTEYRHTYPCHSPTTRRWFQLVARPIRVESTPMVLIVHRDVTPWMTTRGVPPAELNHPRQPDADHDAIQKLLGELSDPLMSIAFDVETCRLHITARSASIDPDTHAALRRIGEQVDRAADLARQLHDHLYRQS